MSAYCIPRLLPGTGDPALKETNIPPPSPHPRPGADGEQSGAVGCVTWGKWGWARVPGVSMGGLTNTQGMGGQPAGAPPGERFSCRGQFGDFCFPPPPPSIMAWSASHPFFLFEKSPFKVSLHRDERSKCPTAVRCGLAAGPLTFLGAAGGPAEPEPLPPSGPEYFSDLGRVSHWLFPGSGGGGREGTGSATPRPTIKDAKRDPAPPKFKQNQSTLWPCM